MTDKPLRLKHKPGDVFQINEKHGHEGWMGCFVMADEIKDFGIRAFVAWPLDHESKSHAYIRLRWDEIDFVGRAPLIPEDILDKLNT